MSIKVSISVLACAGFLVCPAVQASDRSGRMHVQISNDTMSTCRLISENLLHGIYDSAPPQSIMVNDSKAFDMEQSMVGPDVILSYNCGDQDIRFEVQQDFSLVTGHEPKLTVLESGGFTFQSISQSSSVLWDSPGIINITIHSA